MVFQIHFVLDIAQCDITQLVLSDHVQSHKDVISCVIIDGGHIISTGKDGLLKCYNIKEKRQTRFVKRPWKLHFSKMILLLFIARLEVENFKIHF